jgi:cytochrome c-type biogenesis protein CcmH
MMPLLGLDKTKSALLFGLLLLALIIITTPVMAQGPVTDDDVNAIAKDLYCPVCESTPLDVCATQACADWREVIRTKLAEGQSDDEIKAYFELQYGARALAEPPRSGFTLAVWILPIIAVVVGGFFFLRYLSKMRVETAPGGGTSIEPTPSSEITPVDQDPDQDDYTARIERELREM